jgi:hypothetical protein
MIKPLAILFATAALSSGLMAQAYNNLLRQQNLDSKTVRDVQNLAAEGTADSVDKLRDSGARFQLWTIDAATGKNYLLDQQLVGAYQPFASIGIKTQDPYLQIPSTRLDKPFTVTINVSNLISGSGVPEAASRLLLERHVVGYPPEQTFLDPAEVLSTSPHSTSQITSNGTLTLQFPASSVTGPVPLKASGEEHFTLYAIADSASLKNRIATAKVQVWPVTTGKISGISNGDVVRFVAPTLTVAVQDLYPRSDAYLQVYRSSPALGTAGTILNHFFVPNISNKSDSAIRMVSGYEDDLPEEGTYTMELIARTPFGLERLDHVTFSVNRTIAVRAMQTTYSDKAE